MEAHWAVNPLSSSPRGLCLIASSEDEAPDARRGAAQQLSAPSPALAPCASPSAGYPARIPHIFAPRGWLTHEGLRRCAVADVKSVSARADHLSRSAHRGGHGSTLWRDSLTIWRNLRCVPVGIRCQLDQDDAWSGHLEVSPDQRICWKNPHVIHPIYTIT